MAFINLLETRTTSFGDLIGNGKTYQVPTFQRDYSWKQENWEDLWQDILELHKNPDDSHYMGALVLQVSNTSERQFTIIDGQQRLATLSIIAIAIIKQIQVLVDKEQNTKANEERIEILRRTYISDKDPRSLKYSSKLILNEHNNDFYQSRLINLKKPLSIRSLRKTNQLLWNAFEFFSNQLEELNDVVQSGERIVDLLTDTVAKRLLFIQINVKDELNAYTVFETLNARGINLSPTDLLKNYLFSLFKGEDDLKEAQRQWSRIINIVQMEKFPEFLRYYLSLQYTRVRRERLFKIVRELVKTPQQAFDLLDELEDYSNLFIALDNSNDEFWRDRPDSRQFIQELELFRVKQAYPTLLSTYKNFTPQDFNRVLKLICIISLRYTVVSSLNPNDLEKLYNKVAIQVAKGEITTPRQIFENLRSVYVSDDKFSQDFTLLAIPTKGKKKKLVRYILWKLEVDASQQDNLDEDSFSIEHILPESPGDFWEDNFSDTQVEEMVYRLGNLTPLEAKINRDIGNESYLEKQAAYQTSVYKLTQSILAEEWTPEVLVRRQQRMAKQAIHIWRSDFA